MYVLEGRDWIVEESYVKLQVGKFKSKTRVLKNTKNPVWNEEFAFRVHDLEEELVVSVYHPRDDPGFFNGCGDLVGRVKIPVSSVTDEDNMNFPPTWFTVQKPKSSKSGNRDAGKILVTLSLHGRDPESLSKRPSFAQPNISNGNGEDWEGMYASSQDSTSSKSSSRHKILNGKHLMKPFAGRLKKIFNKIEDSSTVDDSSEQSTTVSDYEDCADEPAPSVSFDELMEMMQSATTEREMPENLQGGILVDQTYVVPSKDLNEVLFAPNSQFKRDLADLQGATDVQEGPWNWKSEDKSFLIRVVTYINPPSKLVKAVKATEEQTYIKANGSEFAVSVHVSTPDAPYGNTFKIEILYKIIPGPTLSSGEETSHLTISWSINFHQNTMMRGMIEGGARQGLKDSFDQFASLLSQNYRTADPSAISDKDQMLENLQTEHQSDWELATEYFWNFTVISTIFMAMYVFVHILLSGPSKLQGLEFTGLDLPDSFGELVTSGILVLQLERVYVMVSHFIEARFRKGSDHGVKAQGDGWVLTAALIEGTNLASLDSEELPDPYVVLTCNGKTRTSSVKLQTLDPQWNEILEFDATEEPPSVVDVEVFDFDGPFDQAVSLGHAEINLLKHSSTELADMWVPLEGKLAQACQSMLHLRIFLDNNNGVDTIKEYLNKMEKEVGKKLNLRSPHRNSTFQKLFALPPEEFLISDFSCSLKRKMPLQGRLFLSSRIVGFYANLFGHKTRFFFLWEDIDDVQVLPPSLSSFGSPLLLIILRNGRGLDAKHGAKSQDDQGRLRFYFHSFVSFSAASRTIMALWKTRTLSPEQKVEIAEEQQAEIAEEQHEQDGESTLPDENSSLIVEDVTRSKIYSAEIPVNVKSLMEIFDGGYMEHAVMERSGCLNYVTTSWEQVNLNVFERRMYFKFNRRVSIFGGDVTCTQRKSPNPNGWIVNESMVLHDVPFGDYFRVQLRYEIENSKLAVSSCKCDVYIGVLWLKSTRFQDRVTSNIVTKFKQRLKEIFEQVEREILLASQ